MTSDLGHRLRPTRLGLLPPLQRGQSLAIVVANALVFVGAGWEKGRALGVALNLAGYKPPAPATDWDYARWRLASTTTTATVH
jgi:hypothetical protein